MADDILQHPVLMTNPPSEEVRDYLQRSFARETEAQLRYGSRHDFNVLPVKAPFDGYVVIHRNMVRARCNMLSEAAEIAAALAYFRSQGRPTHEQATDR